jgi:prephenate dehydrogenase
VGEGTDAVAVTQLPELSGAARDAIRGADIVLLAVPEDVTVATLPALLPLVKPGALVADIASVKGRVVATALQHPNGGYVSLHPMFGPEDDLSGNWVWVPVRPSPHEAWLRAFVERHGGAITELSAGEHDRYGAAVQALVHVALLSTGVAMKRLGLDPAVLANVHTRVSEQLLALADRVASNDPALILNLQHANPNAAAARATFEAALSDVLRTLATRDPAAVRSLIEE